MIWLRMILWGIGRGLVSGAIVGALLGTLLAFIAGTAFGLLYGGVIGAILGCVDGILLALITKFAYAPPNSRSYYPQLVYTIAILVNTVPMFIILGGLVLSWAVMPLTLSQTLTSLICSGGIPALVIGIITAYFVGLFLEFVDLLMVQTPTRNPTTNTLSPK